MGKNNLVLQTVICKYGLQETCWENPKIEDNKNWNWETMDLITQTQIWIETNAWV